MGKNELTSRTELSRCVCRGESLLSHAKKLKEKKRRECVCVCIYIYIHIYINTSLL